jgi:DNA-directed RNA polymerase subunit RPC12/RpoP
MPIRFRCSRCNRLLGIARRKAGSETTCPHCGATIVVPKGDESDDERTQFDDIDDLINPAAAPPAQASSPAVATRPAPPPVPRAMAKPVAEPIPLPADERPLFERDVDAVLGATNHPPGGADSAKPKSVTTAGMDAMSLGPDPNHLVISSQKATALVVAVVVLLALAFGAGFLIASR